MDTSVKPVLRVRSLTDLIAVVPVVLGFEPHESLVVVAIAGQRRGFHVRVDLPAPPSPDVLAGLAEQLSAAVRVQACTRVAVLAFTDGSERRVDAEQTLAAVASRLEHDDVEVADVVQVGSDRYWSARCESSVCCPPEGTPFDATASQVRVEATLAGIAVEPSRDGLVARFAPVGGERAAAMTKATRAAEREVVAALGLRGRQSLRRPRRRQVAAAFDIGAARVERLLDRLLDEAVGTPVPVRDADAAALAVWCSVVAFRDLAWCRIDRANARRHLELWSAVSRLAVPPYESAVLCLGGFAAWLAGDGASAWCAVERAEGVDPDYSMTWLLRDALSRCVPPDVWEPMPRELIARAAAER